MSMNLNCIKCSEVLELNVSRSSKNPGKKYFSHKRNSKCNNFIWYDDIVIPCGNFIPRIYLSSEENLYIEFKDDNNSADVNIITQLSKKSIERKNYIQCGRFLAKFDDELFPSKKLVDLQIQLEENLHYINTMQLKRADILVAIFTTSGQYQLIAEIQLAISMSIPVFIKFTNCSNYNIHDYHYIINAVRRYTKNRSRFYSNDYFQNIDLLKSWKSEFDYLQYLEQILLCTECSDSFAPSMLGGTIFVKQEILLPSYGKMADLLNNDGWLDSTEYICIDCLKYLERTLFKLVKTHSKLVVGYLGISNIK